MTTLRMKQNSELRLLESVPIWMVLERGKEKHVKMLKKKKKKGFLETGAYMCESVNRPKMSTLCKVRSHWCVCGRVRAEQHQSSVSSSLCG